MARIISEVEPKYVFVENTPLLVGGGLALVLGDLAEMGYNARWGIIGADAAGYPHRRSRLWLVAHSARQSIPGDFPMPIQGITGISRGEPGRRVEDMRSGPAKIQLFYRGIGDGVAYYVDRIKAIGNGQVPSVAALAWEILK
jgi:DNA (cytosine-5)-methyltransferase 1